MNSLQNRILCWKSTQHLLIRLQSTTSSSNDIQIPFKIERGPTDILKALKSTIKRDPSAPDYKYHDDPFLMPQSNMQKRQYALSKESGKKAAQWVFHTHADLFTHRDMVPEIKAFLPPKVFDPEAPATEEALRDAIESVNVSRALDMFKSLHDKISVQTKLDLLQMFCFYNNLNPLPDISREERWYSKNDDEVKNLWKFNPEIESLFTTLSKEDSKTAAIAYNTYICGMLKHYQANKAWGMYETCKKEEIPLNVKTYNLLIRNLPLIKVNDLDKLNTLTTLLSEMNDKRIAPDSETLGASVYVVSGMKSGRGKEFTSLLISEFRSINIQPTLGVYASLLRSVYFHPNIMSSLLSQIVERLEKLPTLVLQDQADTQFLPLAMRIARQNLQDWRLGNRIHKLYESNKTLIGNAYEEGIYYKEYVLLALACFPFDEFVKFYKDLTPHIYSPEHDVIKQILYSAQLADPESVSEIIPHIWQQIYSALIISHGSIIQPFATMIVTHCKPKEADSPLHKVYANIANTIWNYQTDSNRKKNQSFQWTGEYLGDLALIFIRDKNYAKALEVLTKCIDDFFIVTGVMLQVQMDELIETCLADDNAEFAMKLLRYSILCESGKSMEIMQKIRERCTLSTDIKLQLESLDGKIAGKKENE